MNPQKKLLQLKLKNIMIIKILVHMKSSGYKTPVPMSMVKLIKHPHIIIEKNELEESHKLR